MPVKALQVETVDLLGVTSIWNDVAELLGVEHRMLKHSYPDAGDATFADLPHVARDRLTRSLAIGQARLLELGEATILRLQRG